MMPHCKFCSSILQDYRKIYLKIEIIRCIKYKPLVSWGFTQIKKYKNNVNFDLVFLYFSKTKTSYFIFGTFI